MNATDIELGCWYIIAGNGPMKVIELPIAVDRAFTMTRDGVHYWCMAEQVVRPVSTEFLDNFEASARPRGIDLSWLPEARLAVEIAAHWTGDGPAPKCTGAWCKGEVCELRARNIAGQTVTRGWFCPECDTQSDAPVPPRSLDGAIAALRRVREAAEVGAPVSLLGITIPMWDRLRVAAPGAERIAMLDAEIARLSSISAGAE